MILDKGTVDALGVLKRSKNPLHRMRRMMKRYGLWHANQQLGSRWPVGCVALEVTQRCNLDCTLCYLSEYSQSLHDVPMEELKRRVDTILDYYGPNIDVQVTGGDPTLRDHDELVEIVRYLDGKGLRPTLMTNGIKATRQLMARLSDAGLVDVAFHVDTTQGYREGGSEVALNSLRRKLLKRVEGLPLSVMFNTSIHAGNFHEIPSLVRFFCQHAGQMRTASFQLQADTGRGILSARDQGITVDKALDAINSACAEKLNFDAAQIGHPMCNRYALALVVNGKGYNLYDDSKLIGYVLGQSRDVIWPRNRPVLAAWKFVGWLVKHPKTLLRLLSWCTDKVWKLRAPLIQGRGKATTMSFFVHNFMDACSLDSTRLATCSFLTMTRDGPISMCAHNAKRDAFIQQTVELEGGGTWSPVTGLVSPVGVHLLQSTDAVTRDAAQAIEMTPLDALPSRLLKGRAKQHRLERKRIEKRRIESSGGEGRTANRRPDRTG